MTKLGPMTLNGNLWNGSQPTPPLATPNKVNRANSNVNHIFFFLPLSRLIRREHEYLKVKQNLYIYIYKVKKIM